MAIVRAYGRNLPELPNLLKDPKYAKQRTVLDSKIKRLQSVGAYSSHKSEGFSHEQVLAILQSDATDMSTSSGLLRRVFVLVSICTGLRASGHYGLKRSDFDRQKSSWRDKGCDGEELGWPNLLKPQGEEVLPSSSHPSLFRFMPDQEEGPTVLSYSEDTIYRDRVNLVLF